MDSREPATTPAIAIPQRTEVPEDSLGLVPSSLAPRTVVPRIPPRFENVAEQSGIRFTYYNDPVPDRYFLPEVMGGGAAWLDFDNDGWLDLYLANGCELDPQHSPKTDHVSRLFRSSGNGLFVDVTLPASAGPHGFGQGCAVGDFDADGFADLYLTMYGANVLLHNNGDGTLSDVTAVSQTGDTLWGSSAVWLDLDSDADLDLYVVNYLDVTLANRKVCQFSGAPGYCGPGEYEAVPDRVYVNQGDGTFREGAEELGFSAPGGKGLAVIALDFDHDLTAEIYVANDMAPNFLFTRSRPAYRPQVGEGSLRPYINFADFAGCAVSDTGQNEASMGIACADFDNDDFCDIFLTHFYAHKNTLYRNLGGLLFSDDSRRTRIAANTFDTLGFGTVAFDYDQDGAVDLFMTNGHVLGPKQTPNAMRPQLLRNDGQGRFDEITNAAGEYFRDLWLGRSAAGADYDNDGDLDIAVTHLDRPTALLRNDTRTNSHFLGLELRQIDRVPPTGGRVIVSAGGKRSTWPVVAGGSYLASSDARLLVSLPESHAGVRVEIHWPSGRVEIYENLEVDCYWLVIEGHRLQKCFIQPGT